NKAPNAAPQRVCALSNITSKTGASSPGEELMTCNTSAVAVCWSRASRLGDQPRVFHRTDRLGGEALQQADLLLGEGPNFPSRNGEGAKQGVVLDEPNCHQRPGGADFDRPRVPADHPPGSSDPPRDRSLARG